jgi:predicted ATPase
LVGSPAALEATLAEAEASAGEADVGLRRLDDALAESKATEARCCEAEMHRIRAEILLKRDPADTAAAEQSLQAAIAIARSQKARSFELRAALALAKLYRAANRDADAHAVLAPAVEGFPPTKQFPELTEAQTLVAVLSESDAVKSAAALSQRRLRLQTSLGNALFWTKGYQAPEVSAAFARLRELASREEDASERFSAYYGLWGVHLNRGEPAPMREMAELFLREATARPDYPETLIAHRVSGNTCVYFGDFVGAHDHFHQSIELYDPARHGDFANRFGWNPRAAAEIHDALALWVLGRVDDSLRLADRALTDAELAAHPPTMAHVLLYAAFLGVFRCNLKAVATHGQAFAEVVSRYDLPANFAGFAVFLQGWAKWADGPAETIPAEMRRGLAIVREQARFWLLPGFEAALAEAEASTGETDAGLRRLDDVLAELERTEERLYAAEMHRIRGEILLKRDPADTPAAEQSLQAAIAIAQSQKARSFELRAALSLAKLYRAANRDADAHAVLASAVEGFPPTHQFPELTEAQTLVEALSQSDAVKTAAARNQRRLRLQTSLGNALIWTKGYHAPETAAAFARARKLASREEDASERFSAYYGLWAGHLNRSEPALLREMAELFLSEATARPNCPETLIAHRNLAFTCWYFGDFAGAHNHFRKTIEFYDPARHADFANRFGQDPWAGGEIGDALTLWVLGRIDDALRLADRALADAKSAAHAPTIRYVLTFAALLGLLRYNPEAVATYSQALADIVSRYDLAALSGGFAVFFQGWAKRSDGGEESRFAEMRGGLAIAREQGRNWLWPSLKAALAAAEAGAGETDAGLRRLDDALAELETTEARWYEAEMHRIRAEILLKRDPADAASAERSLQAAIGVAQSQKARSFELRAALSLAKLYRAANRDTDAHAALAPAAEGFPPTQQFPELTEAQALLAALSP